MPKPSPAIVKQRTEELARIILDGAEPPWDTCAYVREKEAEPGSAWEVLVDGKPLSESQIRRYVAKANDLIGESCRARRKQLLRRHLARRRNLYAKAVSQGDIRAALACLDSEAKLLGLFDDEVTRLIDQLQKDIETLKASHDPSNTPPPTGTDDSRCTHAPDEGAAATGGATPPRPGPHDDRSGHGAGPVADGSPDEPLEPGNFAL